MFLDHHELSITPIPESVQNDEQIESSKSQVKLRLIGRQTREDFVVVELVNPIKFRAELAKISRRLICRFCSIDCLCSSISVDSMNLYIYAKRVECACLHICLSIFSLLPSVQFFKCIHWPCSWHYPRREKKERSVCV